ncbi:MAG: hypothetical protein QOE59_1668 [Actinomycetota bacterium]|jgi:asparagine synthase (glutamine-hydrolysing)|nr:hypothetical protein [Actinomycetota bacterium]
MCGITGWVDYERDLRGERQVVEAMTETLGCRGPDAHGVWLSASAGMGHTRLAVIDVEGGAQPMRAHRRGEVVLTFSGEVYNFTELRAELGSYGHRFRTRSDTEVLLHAYLQWGAGCVIHLNGMFAFAVWDDAAQTLLLARDRLGVKPLYYAPRPSGVLFGSEPKAVLAHPGFTPQLDAEGVAELFAPPGTKTPGHGIFRGLHEVLPGTTVTVTRGALTTARYWELAALEHTDDVDTTVATVRGLLEDVVARQLVADVPVCTLLSGGLDSSALSALAARRLADRAPLPTVSVDFAGSDVGFVPDHLRPSYDEPFARQVAEHIGSRHSTVLLTADGLIAASEAPLHAHDLPTIGDMYASMYLLFEGVRAQSTVALSGESADEVFGGYPWYHEPAMMTAATFPWAVGGSWDPVLRREVRDSACTAERAVQRYTDALAEVPRLPGEDDVERRTREVLHLGLTRWLPMLLDRKDRLSMAHGLEVRVPFCDHRLVEYVWNVPWKVKTAGGLEKGLLRQAVTDLLPAPVVERRKSIYPGPADSHYEQAITSRLAALLARPDAPLFALVDHAALTAAFGKDPRLPGLMPVQPGPTASASYLLEVNTWLAEYGIALI